MKAPGKLILSGEHAVVAGRPALATAVNRFANVTLTPLDAPLLRLRLTDRPPIEHPLATLANHLAAIRERHEAYRRGELPIRAVAPTPEDLLLAAVAFTAPTHGLDLLISSDIPLGAGMGSSAAVLVALFRTLRPDWDLPTLHHHALACEHFQHGDSSGIDVAASLHGRLVFGTRGAFAPVDAPTPALDLYHSGTPASTTGECVAAVRANFPTDHPIWNNFEHCTRGMLQALRQHDLPAFADHLRANHQLLCRIGVVPDDTARAIASLEQQGAAGKVCGAGSIRPGPAGLIAVTPHPNLHIPTNWHLLLRTSSNP